MKKLLPILLFAFFCSAEIFAEDTPHFLRPPDYLSYYDLADEYKNITTFDLAGDWKMQAEKGGSWQIVKIPSCWDGFQGSLKFRRSFKIDSSYSGKFINLVMLGVSQRCSVKLNGEFVADREGSLVKIPLPEKLLRFSGDNLLEIEVDNSLHPLYSIPLQSGMIKPYNYGGIYSDIFLTFESFPAISDFIVLTAFDPAKKTGAVSLEVRFVTLPTEEINGSFHCRLLTANGENLASQNLLIPDGNELFASVKISEPALWSPGKPQLYTLEFWFGDAPANASFRRIKIGFRKGEFSDEFKFNGQITKVKGITYRIENEFGNVFRAQDYRRDLDLIRQIGANTVLLADPPHPYFHQLCDSLGLIVFQSSSLEGVPNAVLRNCRFQNIARERFRLLWENTCFHPALCAYVLGLYLEEQPPLDFLLQGFDPAASPLLLIGAAGNPPLLMPLSSPPYKSPDSLIVMDLGPCLEDDSEWSQSFQASQIAQALSQWNASAAGCFLRNFADWRSDRTLLCQKSPLDIPVFYSGIVRRDRSTRVAFRDLQQGWTGFRIPEVRTESEPELLIYPLSGFILLLIIIFYLRSNHVFRVQLLRVFHHPHGFYLDVKNRRFIQKMQSGIVVFSAVAALALLFSALLFKLKGSFALDYLLGHLVQNRNLHSTILEIIRDPRLSVLYAFLTIFFLFLINALVFKIAGLFHRQHLTFGQALIFIFWANANLLLLTPLTLFFFRGLAYELLAKIEILILALFLLWSLSRTLNALRVACGNSLLNVSFSFFCIYGLLAALLLAYFQHNCALFHYIAYFFRIYL